MRNITGLFLIRLSVAIALCAIVVTLGLANASAERQTASDEFKVGDRVEASVSGLEGDQYYEPCVVTEVRNNGYLLKCGNTEFMVQKGWVRRPKNAVAPKPEAKPAPDVKPDPREKKGDDTVAANDPKADAECDFDAPGPKTTPADRFSAAIAKRKIYDNYRIGMTGGVTAPLKTGVTFLSLQVGRSFTNTAVRGFRINDAAPLNTTIYQVHSKHIVCELYRNGTLRRQVDSNYACFKNRDGDWACGLDGIPKIVQLQ